MLSAEPRFPFTLVGTVNPQGMEDVLEVACGEAPVRLALAAGLPRPERVEVVDVTAALESRRTGLVPAGLANKRLVFFGYGSLGANIALLLAQAGVMRFTLVDAGRLDASNLSRHPADLADLGRLKVLAGADLLSRRCAVVTPLCRDILRMPDEELDDLLGPADLAIATTDSLACQLVVNEACVRTGTPLLAGGAYELACGGEIIVTRPGVGPCLYCCIGFRSQLPPGLALQERRAVYQAADAAHRLDAEPGLGTDIMHLAAIAAMHALAVLDPEGSRRVLVPEGHAFTLVHSGSQPRGDLAQLFTCPFEYVQVRVHRPEPCPVCGWRRSDDGA